MHKICLKNHITRMKQNHNGTCLRLFQISSTTFGVRCVLREKAVRCWWNLTTLRKKSSFAGPWHQQQWRQSFCGKSNVWKCQQICSISRQIGLGMFHNYVKNIVKISYHFLTENIHWHSSYNKYALGCLLQTGEAIL